MLSVNPFVEGFKQSAAACEYLFKNIRSFAIPLLFLLVSSSAFLYFFIQSFFLTSMASLFPHYFRPLYSLVVPFVSYMILFIFLVYVSIFFFLKKQILKTSPLGDIPYSWSFLSKSFILFLGIIIAAFILSFLCTYIAPSPLRTFLHIAIYSVAFFFGMASITVSAYRGTFSSFLQFCKKVYMLWLGALPHLFCLCLISIIPISLILLPLFIILNKLFSHNFAVTAVTPLLFSFLFTFLFGVAILFFANAYKNIIASSHPQPLQ
jgi:hypothetical protein